ISDDPSSDDPRNGDSSSGDGHVAALTTAGLTTAAARRAAEPAFLPSTETEHAEDLRIAELAATIALRRHARGEPGRAARKDLRDVRIVVGSGGVLRHADPTQAAAVLAVPLRDVAGGWPLPRHAQTVVDTEYVLAAAGLLASDFPEASRQLLRTQLL